MFIKHDGKAQISSCQSYYQSLTFTLASTLMWGQETWPIYCGVYPLEVGLLSLSFCWTLFAFNCCVWCNLKVSMACRCICGSVKGNMKQCINYLSIYGSFMGSWFISENLASIIVIRKPTIIENSHSTQLSLSEHLVLLSNGLLTCTYITLLCNDQDALAYIPARMPSEQVWCIRTKVSDCYKTIMEGLFPFQLS